MVMMVVVMMMVMVMVIMMMVMVMVILRHQYRLVFGGGVAPAVDLSPQNFLSIRDGIQQLGE
jgi:hypothetical protein